MSEDGRAGGHESAEKETGATGEGSSSHLELLISVVGAILTLALLGFLAYQAVAVGDSGPELTAAVSRIDRVGDQFVAQVRVENNGGKTASGVNVTGELKLEHTTVERATTTISFVPPTSSRRAALVFTRDPRRGRLSVRAAGY